MRRQFWFSLIILFLVLKGCTPTTATFEASPTSTPTPTPTPILPPTPTLTAPSTLTPTPTKTQKPTEVKPTPKPTPTSIKDQTGAELNQQELPSWAKDLFYLELPKWGINITSLPEAERTKVKLNDRYFFRIKGGMPEKIKELRAKNKFLQTWGLEKTDSKLQAVSYPKTQSGIDKFINTYFPTASPQEKEKLKQRFIGISNTIMDEFSDKDPYFHANRFLIIQDYHGSIEALLYEPDINGTGRFIKVLPIPLSTSTPVSTPVP